MKFLAFKMPFINNENFIKTCLTILTSLMLGVALPITSLQAQSVISSAIPSDSNPAAGSTITVDIEFDMSGMPAPDDKLGSFTGTLNWDPSVLSYSSNSGILAGFLGNVVVDAPGGLVTFNGINPTGVGGVFNVLGITFDVVGSDGSSTVLDLEYSAMLAATTFTNLIPFLTVNDGLVTVSGTPTNDPPVLDPIADQSMDEGTLLDVPVSATDINGDNITLTVNNLPSFGSFTDNGDGTGNIHFAPAVGENGVYPNIEVVATDDGTPPLSDTEIFTLTVNQVGGNNVISSAIPSNSNPAAGSTITVDIEFDMSGMPAPDDKLGSFTGTLNWDPSVLSYSSNSGILAGFLGNVVVDAPGGLVTFNGINPTGVGGVFNVLGITFDVVGSDGSSTVLDLEYSAMLAATTFTNLIPFLTVNDGLVTVKLAVEPDIDVSPSSYDYGDVVVGSSASQTFAVSNTGGADLNVSATNLTGSDPGEFSIESGGAPFTVPPGGSHDVVVSFNPSSSGAKSATLSIESNDPDEDPFDVPLSGNGTLPQIVISIPDTLKDVAGDTVGIPVYLTLNGNSVAALGAAIKATNNILSFVDFTPGPIIPGPLFNLTAPAPDSIRMGFFDAGGGPITSEGLLVTIRFRVDPNAVGGEISFLNFSELSAADPLGNPLSIAGVNGKMLVVVRISGNVQYCSTSGGGNPAKPVADLNVDLSQSGALVRTKQTDGAGNYLFDNILSGPNYRVDVHRTSGGIGPSITPGDAFLCFNVFLGTTTVNGGQKLACDVNCDLAINPTDALLIFNRFLGIISQFPCVDDWRVYPASYDINATPDAWKTAPEGINYPNLTLNQLNQDFYTIVRGDPDLSWPGAAFIPAKTGSGGAPAALPEAPLQFTIKCSPVIPGSGQAVWQVHISGAALERGIYAFGAELQYDQTFLQINGVNWGDIVPAEGYQLGHHTFDISNPREATINAGNEFLSGSFRFGGFSTSPKAIRNSGVLLEIEATLSGDVNDHVSLPLRLVNVSATAGCSGTAGGASSGTAPQRFEQIAVQVSDGSLTAAEESREFSLSVNYPNPFNPATLIHYQLPEPAKVQIVIFNALGQKVRILVYDKMQVEGSYEVEWDGCNEAAQPVASGFYFYRIEAKTSSQLLTQTRKMLLLK